MFHFFYCCYGPKSEMARCTVYILFINHLVPLVTIWRSDRCPETHSVVCDFVLHPSIRAFVHSTPPVPPSVSVSAVLCAVWAAVQMLVYFIELRVHKSQGRVYGTLKSKRPSHQNKIWYHIGCGGKAASQMFMGTALESGSRYGHGLPLTFMRNVYAAFSLRGLSLAEVDLYVYMYSIQQYSRHGRLVIHEKEN